MKEINDILHIEGQIKIPGGSPGANKALISDGDGLATWVQQHAILVPVPFFSGV